MLTYNECQKHYKSHAQPASLFDFHIPRNPLKLLFGIWSCCPESSSSSTLIYTMNDQSNPAPNYWFNQARAHIAQFNKLHDEKRGEEKSNLRPDLPSSKRQLKSCLRAWKGSSKSQKEHRPEVRRHRKVRFEGITDNESPSQSLPSRPHRLQSSTSRLVMISGKSSHSHPCS